MKTVFRTLEIVVFSMLILYPAAGRAAPQILGLVATEKPVPLTCENGNCSAEISSFCMQSHRKAPNPGTKYTVSADTVLNLIYRDAKGTVRKTQVENLVSVLSSRGYSSVTISLPERSVRHFSTSSAAIEVGRLSSVVPEPMGDEINPLSAYEIARYTGPLRVQAGRVTETDNSDMVIVRTMNHLINGLPDDHPAAEGDAKKLWAKIIGDAPTANSSDGLKYSSKELKFCESISIDVGRSGIKGAGIRSCLESVHDEFISDTTEKVWNKLNASS